MSRIREHLATELASKVDRYGVVVWSDPEGAYRDAVGDVLPPNARGARFEGSWLSLRREVEGLLVGDAPPRLVIYVDQEAPDPDPLAELRSVGAEFRVLLPSLTKRALVGQFTEHRIEQLASQCATLVDVEAAIGGGDTSLDARLMSVAGGSSTIEIAERLLSGEVDAKLDERELWEQAAEFFGQVVGGKCNELSHDNLWRAVFMRLVQLVLLDALGSFPSGLNNSVGESTTAERISAGSIVRRLQGGGIPAERYAALARDSQNALHLGQHLPWSDDLLDVDIVPIIEMLGAASAIEHLIEGRFEKACIIAAHRIEHSWWVTGPDDEATSFASTWRAISAVGILGEALGESPSAGATLDDLLSWYADRGWRVDAAFRRMELVRATAGLALDELDDVFHSVRQHYERWLDETIHKVTAAVATGFNLSTAQFQRTIYERELKHSDEQTAYVLVDALRYELGADLADRLRRIAPDVVVDYAVATPPTITSVGMAALLPGAEASFSLGLTADDRLEVRIGGAIVRTVKDRVSLLEVAHGKVVDVDLDWVAQARNSDLKRKIDGSLLVLVRSTEIDADGESDQLAASWASFDGTLNVLHTAVARLFHAGVRRVVITADHGFLAVRRLGDDRKIDRPPSGVGELHRRVWVGRGGSGSDATVKVALAEFGIGGDLDVIVPRGLGVFTTGGGLQFFHGGLSAQELVVPVITARVADVSATPKYEIELSVAGGRIATGVVAVTVTMRGDLFTRESGVRLQLTQDGERIARTVGGDGVNFATEIIEATVDVPRVITMQITANLVAGSTATIEVLDATTGVRLGRTMAVEVAANVLVDDEL